MESSLRALKMATGGHFVKIIWEQKLCIDLKRRELRSKVIYGLTKWPLAPFCNIFFQKLNLHIYLK